MKAYRGVTVYLYSLLNSAITVAQTDEQQVFLRSKTLDRYLDITCLLFNGYGRVFSRRKRGRRLKLIVHAHLVPRLTIVGGSLQI